MCVSGSGAVTNSGNESVMEASECDVGMGKQSANTCAVYYRCVYEFAFISGLSCGTCDP